MSTIRADNIGPSAGGTTTDIINGISKHSINFDATTNVVNNSYNNSSLTDNGTGDFTFNFTNNFSNYYYRQYGGAGAGGTSSAIWTVMPRANGGVGVENTVSTLRIESAYTNSTANRTNFDFPLNNSDIFGDLA